MRSNESILISEHSTPSAAFAFRPVPKNRISEDALAQLVDMIVSGEVKPGERLPGERELAQSLSITRTSLREALRRLENMGLAAVRQGDGIYVRDFRREANLDFINFQAGRGAALEPQLLLGMDEARRLMSAMVVSLAARRADASDIKELRRVAGECPPDGSPELLSGKWDYDFYLTIALASKNRAFVCLINTMKGMFATFRPMYSHLDEGRRESIKDLNLRLVDAIESGDERAASAIVEERMRQDMEDLAKRAQSPEKRKSKTRKAGVK
ncbi:MAG TPA: FadR/GntR family transcriptional regulator [bacterium]|nr:FadR/GntR family transcriptional regulator [bacterium]